MHKILLQLTLLSTSSVVFEQISIVATAAEISDAVLTYMITSIAVITLINV